MNESLKSFQNTGDEPERMEESPQSEKVNMTTEGCQEHITKREGFSTANKQDLAELGLTVCPPEIPEMPAPEILQDVNGAYWLKSETTPAKMGGEGEPLIWLRPVDAEYAERELRGL